MFFFCKVVQFRIFFKSGKISILSFCLFVSILAYKQNINFLKIKRLCVTWQTHKQQKHSHNDRVMQIIWKEKIEKSIEFSQINNMAERWNFWIGIYVVCIARWMLKFQNEMIFNTVLGQLSAATPATIN